MRQFVLHFITLCQSLIAVPDAKNVSLRTHIQTNQTSLVKIPIAQLGCYLVVCKCLYAHCASLKTSLSTYQSAIEFHWGELNGHNA